MKTYLFAWNPTRGPWPTLDADIESCNLVKHFDGRWSCGVTRRIAPGDRAFLIKLGPRGTNGIMASGYVLNGPFQAPHYVNATRTALYVNIRYDFMLHPEKEDILLKSDLQEKISNVHWTPQAGGISIPPVDAALLEALWSSHLSKIGFSPNVLPEEVITPERYWEGAVRLISINAYERDPRVRQICLEHYGFSCAVCKFDFLQKYGEMGRGFIHVHHIRPLAEIGKAYEVDPVNDLIPVCPNCHAMIHKNAPPLTVDELKSRISRLL